MTKKQTKMEPMYVDRSLGFEVVIKNAPMKFIRDEWVLALNKKSFQTAVLVELVFGAPSLTGRQVRFVRQWLGETSKEFGERFGVSHATVLNWEKGAHPLSTPTLFLMKYAIVRSLPTEISTTLFDSLTALDDVLESMNRGTSETPFSIPAKLITEGRYRDLRIA